MIDINYTYFREEKKVFLLFRMKGSNVLQAQKVLFYAYIILSGEFSDFRSVNCIKADVMKTVPLG